MDQWYGGLPPHQILTEYLNSKNAQHADFNTPSAEMFKELSKKTNIRDPRETKGYDK